MRRIFVVMSLAALAFAAWGCASTQSSSAGPAGVPSSPVIKESYAAKEIRLGDTWKVYINASDPGGAMKHIVVTVSQPGSGGAYPPSYIRLKGDNTREVSGYIYLNTTQNLHQGLAFTNIMVTAEIKSKGGPTSNQVTFPLHFTNSRQAPPPQGVFQEKDLGPIMIMLEPANKFD